jgi:hypothetical protein
MHDGRLDRCFNDSSQDGLVFDFWQKKSMCIVGSQQFVLAGVNALGKFALDELLEFSGKCVRHGPSTSFKETNISNPTNGREESQFAAFDAT